jgi:phenylpropionate dioxygenase-like ring-hydroxylating dioxygenase large terminal subunit
MLQTTSIADGLVKEGPVTFRVSGRAYADQAVFELEQTRIFQKTWIFVAHESELPEPGDFKTAYLGVQPVIVARADDGAIHVLANRCAHRGAAVCRERAGNTRSFVCPYHSWSYGLDGRLAGIPSRDDPSGYPPGFEQPEGLYRIPRVANYRGFVFACAEPDVIPIEEYLAGGAAQLIDRKLQQSPLGRIRISGQPFIAVYQGNWKFQSENIIDGYHFMHTHRAFVSLQGKYGDTTGDFGVHKGGNSAQMKRNRLLGNVLGSPHGHGVNQKPAVDFDELFEGPYASHYDSLRQRHGSEEMRWIVGAGAACIFPNFGLIHNQLRVWRPISPSQTEVTVYPYILEGAPEDFNQGLLRSHERFYGPAGYGAADDLEVFAMAQQGLCVSFNDWMVMERGMHTEKPMESGEIEGMPSSETVHRAFWRKWRDLMTAEAEAGHD